MKKRSAGLLMYRRRGDQPEVLLVHMGGPYWAKRDLGAWSIPKGEFDEGEDPLEAAKREFQEETGIEAQGDFMPLPKIRQPGGKSVFAWAFEGNCDPSQIHSNSFQMEWPPRSGKMAEFPEVDRADWFTLSEAREKILKGQRSLLESLRRLLDSTPSDFV